MYMYRLWIKHINKINEFKCIKPENLQGKKQIWIDSLFILFTFLWGGCCIWIFETSCKSACVFMYNLFFFIHFFFFETLFYHWIAN